MHKAFVCISYKYVSNIFLIWLIPMSNTTIVNFLFLDKKNMSTKF